MHVDGAKRLAFAVIENCVAYFPPWDSRYKKSRNDFFIAKYTTKVMFIEHSPLVRQVADVMNWDYEKFKAGLLKRLEKEFDYYFR